MVFTMLNGGMLPLLRRKSQPRLVELFAYVAINLKSFSCSSNLRRLLNESSSTSLMYNSSLSTAIIISPSFVNANGFLQYPFIRMLHNCVQDSFTPYCFISATVQMNSSNNNKHKDSLSRKPN